MDIGDPQSAEDYATLLSDCTPFIQGNYGDGEWSCMLGIVGENSQGGVYRADLGAALKQTIVEPRFTMWGYSPGRRLELRVQRWLRAHGVNVPRILPHRLYDPERGSEAHTVAWVHKEILSAANVRGRLGGVLAAIARRRALLIGPEHLADRMPVPIAGHVITPPRNAWLSIDKLEADSRAAIAALAPDLVMVSCGMAAKPLMWRLAPDLPLGASMLDTGAIWDPYAGVLSRSGYRRPECPQKMKHNVAEMRRLLCA